MSAVRTRTTDNKHNNDGAGDMKPGRHEAQITLGMRSQQVLKHRQGFRPFVVDTLGSQAVAGVRQRLPMTASRGIPADGSMESTTEVVSVRRYT